MNHVPVLSNELISGLKICPGGLYLDATLGYGGHTQLILAAAPDVKVIAIDQDEQAIASCQTLLGSDSSRVEFCHSNFADYHPQNLEFDGIIADLGINSVQ